MLVVPHSSELGDGDPLSSHVGGVTIVTQTDSDCLSVLFVKYHEVFLVLSHICVDALIAITYEQQVADCRVNVAKHPRC